MWIFLALPTYSPFPDYQIYPGLTFSASGLVWPLFPVPATNLWVSIGLSLLKLQVTGSSHDTFNHFYPAISTPKLLLWGHKTNPIHQLGFIHPSDFIPPKPFQPLGPTSWHTFFFISTCPVRNRFRTNKRRLCHSISSQKKIEETMKDHGSNFSLNPTSLLEKFINENYLEEF